LSEQLQEVALTEEEKDTILSYCGPEPLLVGGQALAFWAVWFKIESPAELGDKVTTDADFIGSSKNARALNKQLHWTMWTPSLDDSTPQTAKLTRLRLRSADLGKMAAKRRHCSRDRCQFSGYGQDQIGVSNCKNRWDEERHTENNGPLYAQLR
jgi:hypothetical protein